MGIYLKLQVYILQDSFKLDGKDLKAFPLNSETRKRCLLYWPLFNILLKSLVITMGWEGNNWYINRKISQYILYADDDFIHKLLNLINTFKNWEFFLKPYSSYRTKIKHFIGGITHFLVRFKRHFLRMNSWLVLLMGRRTTTS